jgi:RNA polymerase sigma-70 factor (ECF subfamily)
LLDGVRQIESEARLELQPSAARGMVCRTTLERGDFQQERLHLRCRRQVKIVGSSAVAEVSDEALMLRYQRGDLSAFAELVARHKTPLFNFVLRQVGASAPAEDLVQEVFVRVIENAGTFKHEAKFTTWAYTIARNLCVDQHRKASYRRHASLDERDAHDRGEGPSLGDQVADSHPRASTERRAIANEIQIRVVAALDALPGEQREVFLLRQVANLPFQEIASITGTPENTVKSRMRYALERLQEALTEFEEYARALR